MTATYSQTGGIRVGGSTFLAFNATWPFASLNVDDSAITLSCLGKRWKFPKSSIRSLSKHQGILSVGLRIQHSIESYSDFLVFWTFSFGQLKQELEERGYSVS